MDKDPAAQGDTGRAEFRRQVDAKAARKLKARRTPLRSIWLGFGVTGVIGWSVAAPALLGALLGIWLDRRFPAGHSWTLALLVAGLCIGCFQAWNWVAREDRAMHDDQNESQDPQEQEEEDR